MGGFWGSLADMRRLLNLIFQLVASAIVIFLFTGVWIVFDGLADLGNKADVAVVIGHLDSTGDQTVQPRLDRFIQLYNDAEVPVVIVGAAVTTGPADEPETMAKYLESHGIPADVIIQTHPVGSVPELAGDVERIMKEHRFQSVMIIADYYQITRIKLELMHQGVATVQKVHVGRLRKADLWTIGREVVALYEFLGRNYLLPALEKAKEEAQVGLKKAGVDAQEAKEKVNTRLDNMAK